MDRANLFRITHTDKLLWRFWRLNLYRFWHSKTIIEHIGSVLLPTLAMSLAFREHHRVTQIHIQMEKNRENEEMQRRMREQQDFQFQHKMELARAQEFRQFREAARKGIENLPVGERVAAGREFDEETKGLVVRRVKELEERRREGRFC